MYLLYALTNQVSLLLEYNYKDTMTFFVLNIFLLNYDSTF